MRLLAFALVAIFLVTGIGMLAKLHRFAGAPVFSVNPGARLAASPASAIVPVQTSGTFDETGTIVMDYTEGSPAIPYLLYTDYKANGKPAVVTKRLIFPDRTSCSAQGLPCATPQGPYPIEADQTVRVIGTALNQTVEVRAIEVLAAAP